VIWRLWRGVAHPDRARDYIRHLRTETLPALRMIPGFVDASILSRPFGPGVEFLIVTRWDSMDAIVTFAGADPEVAVLPAGAVAMMIECDLQVRHYEVVA